MFILELIVLFLLAVLVIIGHRRMIKINLVDFDVNLERIEDKAKYHLNLFFLKILKKIKIINLQFANFLDKQVEKCQNATQKNKISQSPEREIKESSLNN